MDESFGNLTRVGKMCLDLVPFFNSLGERVFYFIRSRLSVSDILPFD